MPVDWKEQAKRRVEEKQDGSWYKLQSGLNMFRVLVPKNEMPYADVTLHYEVGPDKRGVRCGKTSEDPTADCWLCDEQIPKLEASGKESQIARAQAIAPKDGIVFQVSKVSETGKFFKPKPFSPSISGGKSFGTVLLNTLANSRKPITDPKKGYNISTTRTGQGMQIRDTPPELDEDPTPVPDEILAQVLPWKKLIPPYSEKEQKKAYFGEDAYNEMLEREGDEDAAPKKRKVAPVDDDSDDDQEELVSAPAKSKLKKAAPVLDDDDADDEEEPVPVKKKKAVVAEPEEDDDSEPVVVKKKRVVQEEDDDLPVAPVKKKKPAPVVEEDDGDDSEIDEEPAPSKKAAPVAAPVKKKAPVVDPDELDDDELESDDDEPPPPPKKKAAPVAAPAKKKPAPVIDDSDDEILDDADEDDEPPPPKKAAKKRAVIQDEEEDE